MNYKIFLGFFLTIHLTTQVNSYENSLEELYNKGNSYFVTIVSNNWDSKIKFLSILGSEYEDLCTTYENTAINKTTCLQLEATQAIKDASMKYNRCKYEKQYDFENFVDSIVEGYKIWANLQGCFKHTFKTKEILKCIDHLSLGGKSNESYQYSTDVLYSYNNILTSRIDGCVKIFNDTLINALLNTQNRMNVSVTKQAITKALFQFKFKIIKEPVIPKFISQIIDNMPLDLYIDQKLLFEKTKTKSHQVIQKIALNTTESYYNILAKTVNPHVRKNFNCCSEISIERIGKATVDAIIENNKCLDDKTSELDTFVTSTLEDNLLKELFVMCYKKNLYQPMTILTCIEGSHSNATEIYSTIANKLRRNRHLTFFDIRDCLNRVIRKFTQIVSSSNIFFNNCINIQSIGPNCYDSPFYFNKVNNDFDDHKIETVIVECLDGVVSSLTR